MEHIVKTMAMRNQNKNPGLTIVEENDRERRDPQSHWPDQGDEAPARSADATSALAGGIAHVFNNMLTAIACETELAMLHLPSDHPARKHLAEIENVGERGAALARQLLAASGRQVLHPKLFQVNDLLRDMEETVKRLLGDTIELKTVLASDLARVEADPRQIEQAILQIATNARDAMPDGGRLVVETSNVTPEDGPRAEAVPGAVAIRISDSGVGMEEHVRRHAFEPFFTTKHGVEASGLGLATVYGVVAQSGGTVTVDSEPGRGSTFTIVLPAAEPAARPGDGRTASDVWQTILLVEDEDNVRKPLAEILGSRGYRVLEAAHGREAVQVSQRHQGPIHIMVTDILMGDMSGVELADRLSFQRPEMKVLYATGYPAGVAERPSLTNENTPLLKKPFSGRELAAKIREVLDSGD